MQKLIIVCAGGHGRETAWVAKRAGFDVVGFLDTDHTKHQTIISGFQCLGDTAQATEYVDCGFTVAVGNNRLRKKIVAELRQLGVRDFPLILDPSVVRLSDNMTLGEGVVAFPGAIISDNVTIGAHSILNANVSISHDSQVGDLSILNPNATICGNCTIENGVEVGASATVIQGLTISEGAFLGAGAVATKDCEKNTLYIGVPARRLRSLDPFS